MASATAARGLGFDFRHLNQLDPMATAKPTQTITIDLTLDEAEARYLMGVLQNPMGNLTPEQENPEVQKHRHGLFRTLHAALEAVRPSTRPAF